VICAKCHSDIIKHRQENYKMTGWLYNHYICMDCGSANDIITDKLIIRNLKLKKIYDMRKL